MEIPTVKVRRERERERERIIKNKPAVNILGT
jgi:hypothetical protein